jgi:hypothetical protein
MIRPSPWARINTDRTRRKSTVRATAATCAFAMPSRIKANASAPAGVPGGGAEGAGGGHSGPRPPPIEHPYPASHLRQQPWPGETLGIAPSTAVVASAPIRAVPTPGGTPASVVRTSPAPIGTLVAVIPVRRAMRRNPSAPPLAPMTGHWVPTRAAAAPHLDDARRGAHPDRSLV